jgi:uncharacterized protein YbjT (DUF2867 family)
MNDQILVTGATGQQGGAVIRHLLRTGQKIRILTRQPKKADSLKNSGIEVVQGDLTDRVSLDKALKGIRKMFLVTTPYELGMDAEVKQGITAVDAANDAGIEHLVYSSVGSAHRNTGIPHFETKWQVEQRIRELGLKNTIFRPVFFMDNFGSPWLLPMLKSGAVSMLMHPDRKLAMVAVDNIGAYAAAAFLNPDKFIGEAIELAGDELTIPAALNMISRTSGKEFEFQTLSNQEAEKALGYDAATMYKWFNEVGYNPDIPGLRKRYGLSLLNFGDYLKIAPWLNQLRQTVKTR